MSSYLSPVIQNNDQIIFVKGSIKEKEIDFLLDTGAEITVIPTKLAQGLNIPYKKTKLCLTGVIGEDSVLYETPPIEVQFGPKTLTTKLLCAPLNTGAILGMDLLRQINLTLDMSSESTSIKISSAQISTNNATPPEYAFLQNHPIWAKDKDGCGLLTGVEPVKLTGTPPPVTKQYPINKEAIQGIKLIVENLLTQGVLVKTNSPCNEFVLEDEGEMTHDCVTLTYAATSEIAETPIENAELELFVDGSAQVIEGNRRAGYAVTSTTEVVASGRLPDNFSAQAAELVALTRACTLASGLVANIYTDSRF